MDQQEILKGLEVRAKAVGLPIAEACKRAGIHPTTFSRWKLSEKNPTPKGATIDSVGKVERAIADHEAAVAQHLASQAEAA